MEQLQFICEELDPLEATYADVRFLDVDYDQTEKQYDVILTNLNKELNDENNFNNDATNLQKELNNVILLCESNDLINLKQCQINTLPTIKMRFESLQNDYNNYLAQRKLVKPNFLIENNIDNIIENVNVKIDQLEQQQINDLITKLDKNLSLLPVEPSDYEINVLVEELNYLPQNNSKVIELVNQINNIKNEKIRKEKLKNSSNKKINNIAEKINSISEKHLILLKVDKKKRKHHKKNASSSKNINRNDEIDELQLDINHLENELIPLIKQLNDNLISEKIELPLFIEQQSKSIELLEKLQVCNYVKNFFFNFIKNFNCIYIINQFF